MGSGELTGTLLFELAPALPAPAEACWATRGLIANAAIKAKAKIFLNGISEDVGDVEIAPRQEDTLLLGFEDENLLDWLKKFFCCPIVLE